MYDECVRKKKLWARVLSVSIKTALGQTPEGDFVLIPLAHKGITGLQAGDIISFHPKPYTPPAGVMDVKAKWFAWDPFIIAVKKPSAAEVRA